MSGARNIVLALLAASQVADASVVRSLLVNRNCGNLGGEMCDDGSCNGDLVPVNLGGSTTVCRKPEEAAAQLGIGGDNGGGDDSGGDNGGGDNGGGDDSGSPCGKGGEPVCSGEQLIGRTYECDQGWVGKNGKCVPYEENITSTPTRVGDRVQDFIKSVRDSGDNGGGDDSSGDESSGDESSGDDSGNDSSGDDDEKKETPSPSPTPSSSPPSGSGKATGAGFEGHITHFDKMGEPSGGCGLSNAQMVDDNGKMIPFVALNTNSEFENGNHCGQWIEITLQENCNGGYNSQWGVCNGREFVHDEHSGEVIYGYITDSCADPNFWCQNDPYHIDVSTEYLRSLDLIGEHNNGRLSTWKYMDGTPPGYSMKNLKYTWMHGSRWLDNGGFHAALIISNTDNGISGVEVLDEGTWRECKQMTHLGNIWMLPEPDHPLHPSTREFTVRVTDVSGVAYGEDLIPFSCGNTVCSNDQQVSPM